MGWYQRKWRGQQWFYSKKGREEYRGIGFVEVVLKVCAAAVNFWLNRGVTLHDELHGFKAGRGIGTATLEAKLDHQLVGITHEPLFQVFLDVQNAYYSLDKGCRMEILRGYGIGQNTVRLISHNWDNPLFFQTQAGS